MTDAEEVILKGNAHLSSEQASLTVLPRLVLHNVSIRGFTTKRLTETVQVILRESDDGYSVTEPYTFLNLFVHCLTSNESLRLCFTTTKAPKE